MADTLSNLRKPTGATKAKARLGRGVGSGLGKTSGRGQKGQYARSGRSKPNFEGGQTPLARRLPKRGFKSKNTVKVLFVNVASLEGFAAGSRIDEASMRDAGLIRGRMNRLKVLGNGEIRKNLIVVADAFSEAAVAKIRAAGGEVVIASEAL